MTLFAAILSGLGLSQSEAAQFLSVPRDTVHSWASGRRSIPPGIWPELHALAIKQDRAAREIVKTIKDAQRAAKGKPDAIELGIANDDAEAKALGWSCAGAQAAVFRRVWELLGPDAKLKIVLRGSTAATKAAIGARQARWR